MLYYQTKFGCKLPSSLEDKTEIVIFWLYKPSYFHYISPHCDLDIEHSEQIFLQDILSPNLVWLCSIIRQSVVQKNLFTVFNVKVTVRAYIIKIWLFLLCLHNCWSVCNQTWLDSTARVSCGKVGLLRSRSRSQQMFKMSVCPIVVWWCIIMRQRVVWKNWFTIFNVKVTTRAYMIKNDYLYYIF